MGTGIFAVRLCQALLVAGCGNLVDKVKFLTGLQAVTL